MKLFITLSIILLTSSNLTFAQKNKCVRQANFGTAKICLPQIDGYEECYTYPIIKELADKTEVPANNVLGYYINNKIFSKKDSLGIINYDDFFKVYATKQIKDVKADASLLKSLKEMFDKQFIKENWEEISKDIDQLGNNTKIGVPTVIEDYSINKKSFTFIMLAKYDPEGQEPYTVAMTINAYINADRLIWMAYYLNYENLETIVRLKKNSNRILNELIMAGQ